MAARRAWGWVGALALALGSGGCAEFPERSVAMDAGGDAAVDGAPPLDAGRADAGDGALLDAALADAAQADAAQPDGALPDGAPDGGGADQGPMGDAGRPDAVAPDAETPPSDAGPTPAIVVDEVAPVGLSAVGDRAFRAATVAWRTDVVGEVGVFVEACGGALLPGSVVDHPGGAGTSTVDARDLVEGLNALVLCVRVDGALIAEASFSLTRDDTPPAAPEGVVTRPLGPSTDQAVTLAGTAEAASVVEVHVEAGCPGAVGQAVADAAGAFAVPDVEVARDAETTFFVVLVDALGNRSPCHGPVAAYVNDTTPPPLILDVVRLLSLGRVQIEGRTEAGATVAVHTVADCSDPGGRVMVGPDGSFTQVVVRGAEDMIVYVRAVDAAGLRSACVPVDPGVNAPPVVVATGAACPLGGPLVLAPLVEDDGLGDGDVQVARIDDDCGMPIEVDAGGLRVPACVGAPGPCRVTVEATDGLATVRRTLVLTRVAQPLRFEAAPAAQAAAGPAVVVVDLDRDGRPETVVPGPEGLLWVRNLAGPGPPVIRPLGGPSDATALVAADFDLDGLTDLAAAAGARVALLRGDLESGVRPTGSLNRAAPVAALGVAKVAGDARPDLLTLTAEGALGVAIGLSSDGAALELDDGVPVAEGLPSAGLAGADLDHDGQADLVLVGPEGGVQLRGDAGDFAAPMPLPRAPADASSVAIGDLDRDGRPDVVTAGPGGVALHRQRASTLASPRGLFDAAGVLEIDLPVGPAGVALVDLAGADTLALIVGGADAALRIVVDPLERPQDVQTLVTQDVPTAFAVADVDRDGLVDLIVVTADGAVQVLRQRRPSSRAFAGVLGVSEGPATALATLAGEGGATALIVADGVDTLRLYPPDDGSPAGLGALAPLAGAGPVTRLVGVGAAGDGRPLLLGARGGAGGGVGAWRQRQDGSLEAAGGVDVGGAASWVAAADLDGDGRPGVVAVNAEGLVVGLPWVGPGPLDLRPARSVDPDGVVVALAVVDAPASAGDAAVVLLAGGQTKRLHLDDAGQWVTTDLGVLAQRGVALVTADVNLDGRRDLLIVDGGADRLRVVLGVEGGFAAPADGSALPDGVEGAAVADLDADGRPDLVSWGASPAASVVVWAVGTPAARVTPVAGAAAWRQAVGLGGRLAVATAAGAVRVHPPVTRRVPTWGAPTPLGFSVADGRPRVADIDGNGLPDVAVAAGALGGNLDSAEVWLQDRDDIVGKDGSSLLPLCLMQDLSDGEHDTHDLALIDVDGDGWLDLLLADRGEPSDPEASFPPGLLWYSTDPAALNDSEDTLFGLGYGAVSGAFGTTNSVAGRIATGDLDLDGRADVVAPLTLIGGLQTTVFSNQVGEDDMAFVALDGFARSTGAGATVVDLDRDGHLDLVADGGRAGAVLRLRVSWNPAGSRATRVEHDVVVGEDTSPEAVDVRVADVDGDGWPDLVAVGTDGAIDLYRQVAGVDAPPDLFVGPAFEEAVRLAPPCGCVRFVEVADLNGDAAVDLLAWRRDVASLTVWDRDPAAALGEAFTPRVVALDAPPGDVVLHDMDRDGRLDLLLRSGGEVFLRLQDGPR